MASIQLKNYLEILRNMIHLFSSSDCLATILDYSIAAAVRLLVHRRKEFVALKLIMWSLNRWCITIAWHDSRMIKQKQTISEHDFNFFIITGRQAAH